MADLALNKERIIEVLDNFPATVLIEDFIDKIVITAKIEKGLEQFDRGEYMTSEELDKEIEKWD